MTDSLKQPGQAGTDDEIEITPEMVGAGLVALLRRCPDSATGDISDQRMVAEIFKAMLAEAASAVRG